MVNKNIWNGQLVDAYAHIGVPRFGSLENLSKYFERLNIKQGVLALGPGLPDFESIIKAKDKFGNDIRFMGIPFGETEKQRLELGELQISMGISGMRLMPFEIEPNKELIGRLGEEGLWLFAINPYNSMEMTAYLLDWLERYPKGRIASPHFLIPETIEKRTEDKVLFKELLKHPRFHAILSRHGGVESNMPYPHVDLKPWVEEIVELVTWKRLMWGGEFPIFYERGEQPENVRDWMLNLGIEMSEENKQNFYCDNALKLLFDNEHQLVNKIDIPGWVQEQVDDTFKVGLFTTKQVSLSGEDYNVLLTEFLEESHRCPEVDFSKYISEKLSESAEMIRRERN